ncbi:MAG: LytTR family transcriptional regulator [Chitinophagaceae bacterium]|nr:LytTR family transcriptional regulator [Rubrivivax sp.]
MHQRLAGCTNGKVPVALGRSAGAHLTYAGALLALTLTLMEPASAFGLAWWQRAGFYAAHVAPAMAVAWWASGWLFNQAALQRWPSWVLLALAGGAAGVALAPWSVALEMALGIVDLDEPGAAPLPLTAAAWWSELADELLHVPARTALFWVAMNVWVLWRAQRQEPTTQMKVAPRRPDGLHGAAPAPATELALGPPPLLDRLPARLGRDVVLLEAQQHYLSVVTTRGEHLLLHGLAPAVAELAQRGIAGMQIHRSVWVAWAHVERLDLRPGSLAAVLRDGRRLPVGRRRARDVEKAWMRWPAA